LPVRRISFIPDCKVLVFVFTLCVICSPAASAQPVSQTPQQRPTVILPTERPAAPAARASEFACGGFITLAPPAPGTQIVGAVDESEQRLFAEGDQVFINAGAQEGVRQGQEFAVVRPRGQFRSKLSRKKGSLGVYTQEVGRVRVVRVKDRSSVAEVVASCDNLLFGDLLRPVPQGAGPTSRAETALDKFAEPTGRQTGRIVLARDAREMISRDQVVFIDLGSEDNVKAGDYLTVFRPTDHGVLVKYGDEITRNARDGYESDEFRGGKFSNQAQRLKDTDDGIKSENVKTPKIIRRRPPVPRKVVGEVVILHVEARTATAVVTRIAQEMHTGDYVEVQ
jgi:hypothetical protein